MKRIFVLLGAMAVCMASLLAAAPIIETAGEAVADTAAAAGLETVATMVTEASSDVASAIEPAADAAPRPVGTMTDICRWQYGGGWSVWAHKWGWNRYHWGCYKYGLFSLDYLGGLDVYGYCRSLGYSTSVATGGWAGWGCK